ncbi:MAG: hypothetical protein Q8L64_03810 [bacterium]|nr:hypothetical protein [bacterium]
MKRESTLKRNKVEQKVVLEQLRKIPIVQIACERSNIGRSTYYRWRRDDEKFKKATDEAMQDGEEMINDLSESQLITLIKEKNFPAIQLWLRQHHPKYRNKVELTTKTAEEEALTPQEEKMVREALGLTVTEHA